jgi:fluoride exporter
MVGTPARYALERIIHVAPGTFPWSTFTVNVTGCLVLGALLTLIIERWPPSRYVRAFAVIGFLGAYTTFSTYTVEAVTLTKDNHADIAAAYVVASLVVGLVALYAGIVVARVPMVRGRGA